MRHRISKRKLNRKPAHLKMMLANLATSIILYEEVTTTEAKAKAVKPLVDRLIARVKGKEKYIAIRYLNARVPDPLASKKIMEVLLDRYKDRPSGFTSLTKKGFRKGDGAPIVTIKLVA